jgi:alanine racemase
VATVGIGYRHGLPWRGADRLTARIGAQSVPVIGRLSMGYLAVDATDLSDERCHPGARVDLLDDRLSLDELADAAGTAAQPILLRLGAACRRRYLPADACDPPDAVQPDSPVQRC